MMMAPDLTESLVAFYEVHDPARADPAGVERLLEDYDVVDVANSIYKKYQKVPSRLFLHS